MNLLIKKRKNGFCRVAFVDSKKLLCYNECFLNHEKKRGSIYFGTVVRVEPNLRAVFVDYGEEKLGFLSFYSIHPSYFNITPSEREHLMKNMAEEKIDSLRKSIAYNRYKIEEVIKIGDKVLVQVIRSEKDYKGVMLSTFVSLGINFSYVPNSVNDYFIFGKNIPVAYQESIKSVFKKNKAGGSFSLLKLPFVSKQIFLQQVERVLKEWSLVVKELSKSKKNRLIKPGNNIIEDALQNSLIRKVQSIIFEGENKTELMKLTKKFGLDEKIKIKLETNIFENFEEQVENIFNQTVDLSSGGFLIISSTPACWTIDVNLGKNNDFNYHNAILTTNIEAAREAALQISLRNLSGVILIDFIDMENKDNQNKVFCILKNELEKDEAKISMENISSFGTVTICRQYLDKFTVTDFLSSCEMCNGRSVMKIDRASEILLEKLSYIAKNKKNLQVHLSEEIMHYVANNLKSEIIEIENANKCKVEFLMIQNVVHDYYEISTTEASIFSKKHKNIL